jgi:molecular chaperone DnaJ
MARAIRDYYRVLGVSPQAETPAIRRAHRELVDEIEDEERALGPSDELDEARRDADEALMILTRKDTRAAFDEMREQIGWWDTGWSADIEEEHAGVAAEEAIEAALRRVLSGDRPSRNGRVLEFKLPFELAALGGRARVRVPMRAACPECAGLGGDADHATPCSSCGGDRDRRQGCTACQGRGWLVMIDCARCGGEGWVPALGSAELVIPPGVTDGTLLPLPGFAENDDEDVDRAPRIRVKVSSHPFFRRVGRDILCKVPVSRRLAERGSTIRVKTLRGEDQKVTVPPHTPDGTVLRLVGEGIDADGERGDQLIEIRVRPRRGQKSRRN